MFVFNTFNVFYGEQTFSTKIAPKIYSHLSNLFLNTNIFVWLFYSKKHWVDDDLLLCCLVLACCPAILVKVLLDSVIIFQDLLNVSRSCQCSSTGSRPHVVSYIFIFWKLNFIILLVSWKAFSVAPRPWSKQAKSFLSILLVFHCFLKSL